jgi:hypothetical protein
MYSAVDINTFVANTIPTGATTPYGLAYSKYWNAWFAACDNLVGISDDGVSWAPTPGAISGSGYLNIACWGKYIYVIASGSTTSWLSTDRGVTWSGFFTGVTVSNWTLTASPTKALFVDTTGLAYETMDGNVVNSQGYVGGSSHVIGNNTALKYINGQFVCVGAYNAGGPFISTSPDGTPGSWTNQTAPTGGTWANSGNYASCISYGAGTWVVCSGLGDVSYSTDGMATWTYIGSTSNPIFDITYSEKFGGWIIVGVNTIVAMTDPTVGWFTPTTLPSTSPYVSAVLANDAP